MTFKPKRLTPDAEVYRALDWDSWANEKSGKARPRAFRRNLDDHDGITVLPCIQSCFALRLKYPGGIARIRVSDIERAAERLCVVQDEAEHAFIENVPFFDEDRPMASKIADAIAAQSELLSIEEIERCRLSWLSSKQVLNEPTEGLRLNQQS